MKFLACLNLIVYCSHKILHFKCHFMWHMYCLHTDITIMYCVTMHLKHLFLLL